MPHGMWDLSSLTRDQTCAPYRGPVLTTGPPRKSPKGNVRAGMVLQVLLNRRKGSLALSPHSSSLAVRPPSPGDVTSAKQFQTQKQLPVWDAAMSPGQLGVGCATLKERSGQSTKSLQASRSPDNNILLRMHELNWNGHIWMVGFEHIFFSCLSIFSSQARYSQCTSKNIPVVVTAMVKLDVLFIYINMEKF